MNFRSLGGILLALVATGAGAQSAQVGGKTQIKGNTEINVNTKNMTAVAAGSGTVAKNRVGVIQGGSHGDTKISASVGNVTNVAVGRGRKSCVNIGSKVSDECK